MLLVVGALIISCFITISISSVSVYGVPSNPNLFLKGSTPYEVPYEEWLARWWQWNLQIPTALHPIANPGITECPVGDSGPVSFLTQKLQGNSQYNCTIPTGNAILVPIGTGECTNDEAKSNIPEEMIKCATEGDKYITFDSSIDDISLLVKPNIDPNLDENNNYATTRIFDIMIPDDNFLNLVPGQWKDAAAGYFIFLKPLATGDHTLRISAQVINPIDPNYDFKYDTTFLLRVQ